MGCCATLAGITLGCDKGIGGIRRAWIACYDEVNKPTVTSNQITAITPTNVWKEYNFRKQTGSVTSTNNSDDAAGTSYWENVITLQFTKQETVKRIEINALAISDVAVIIEDNNGIYTYYGFDDPVTLTDGTAETGTAYADFNGYNISLTDWSKQLPYEVTAEAMEPIISAA